MGRQAQQEREAAFGALRAMQQRSAGYALILAARRWNELAIARVNAAAAGGPVLREAHTRLLPYLTVEGARTTELARQVGVSKQAVSKLVVELEAVGVVEQRPDPLDGRATLVRLTSFGLEAMEHGTGVLLEVERDVAKVLGSAKLRALRELLRELAGALEGLEAPRR